MDETLFMSLFVGLITGMVIGAIPGFYGATKNNLGLGLLGFVCCTISGLVLGMLLAIPVGIAFVYFIRKQGNAG